MARPDGPLAAGRDEGTPHSGARRQPDAGIIKGRASACSGDLKFPIAWRATLTQC